MNRTATHVPDFWGIHGVSPTLQDEVSLVADTLIDAYRHVFTQFPAVQAPMSPVQIISRTVHCRQEECLAALLSILAGTTCNVQQAPLCPPDISLGFLMFYNLSVGPYNIDQKVNTDSTWED